MYSVLLTVVISCKILLSQDYSLSITKIIKLEIVILKNANGGGGQTQKALPEPLRSNCEPAGLPPPP